MHLIPRSRTADIISSFRDGSKALGARSVSPGTISRQAFARNGPVFEDADYLFSASFQSPGDEGNDA